MDAEQVLRDSVDRAAFGRVLAPESAVVAWAPVLQHPAALVAGHMVKVDDGAASRLAGDDVMDGRDHWTAAERKAARVSSASASVKSGG